ASILIFRVLSWLKKADDNFLLHNPPPKGGHIGHGSTFPKFPFPNNYKPDFILITLDQKENHI
ncbi:MAG: hypothetical protein ACI86M_003158, partial [Saprospiraceae bacterium]